jgi:tetratricopeptide (TPR) repeat protein
MIDNKKPSSDPVRERPTLTPPGRDKVRKKDNRLTVLLILVALFVLLGMAATVIWLLPDSGIQKNTTASVSPSLPIISSIKEPEAAESEQSGAKVKQLLGEWLRLQARAEAENIAAWGADRYPDILAEAAKGDQMYQENLYTEAQRAYQNGIRDLNDLLASKENRLRFALENGEQALAEQNSEAAADHFDMALTIDPNNQQASRGLERARNLEQVLALYHQGLEFERLENLTAAQQVLQEATIIDSAFVPAREGLIRVENRMQELAFQKAMSRTLEALNNNETVEARKSLAEAARLRPADESVKDAGLRLAAMEKSQRLAQLQDNAEKLTAEERWGETLQIYDKALAIDPHFAFAESGRKVIQQRFELDRQAQDIISRPDRLQESGPMQEAETVLLRLQSIENPGPRLQKQINELDSLIRTASIPAEVILRSDNETSVVIYRVGKFGHFLEKRVSLLPGSYIVVGSRPGFRDVRKTLKVQAGTSQVIIDIRCEEPI